MSGTHDCGGDAAAYVLGALGPREAEAFRAHMHECAVCRDEVEALGGVVQALPMAAHQYEPPGELRRRIMRDVRHHPRAEAAPAPRAGRCGDARASCLPPARPPCSRAPAWS